MSEELKPCPFCGGEAKVYLGSYSVAWVKCLGECRIETPTQNTREDAIAKWNRRAKDGEQ